jgi:hypothetical protein
LKTQDGSIRNEWLAAFVLCLAVSAVAALPFFYIGEDRAVGCCGGEMPVTHDSWMHFNQMQAFARGLAAGRIYPRWDEATHGGYGAPTSSFYPPGVYYLTSFLYFISRDWQKVWMGTWWWLMFASGLALYAYVRSAMSHGAALLAASLYMVLPYHLLNQYQRGALAEQGSFVWMPLCLLFAEQLYSRLIGCRSLEITNTDADQANPLPAYAEKRVAAGVVGNQSSGKLTVCRTWGWSFCGLAASYGAFLWTHPPTAYQFTLIFGVFSTAWLVWRKAWRALGLTAAGLLLGVLLAAAYFFPAFLEQSFIHADDVDATWPYHATYVYDSQQPRFDHADPFFARVDFLWAFNVLLLMVAVRALLSWGGEFRQALDWRAWADWRQARVAWWLAAGVFSSFLMTRYSAPLGRLIPKLEIGVFSWRMLGISSLVVALLIGLCAQGALMEASKFRRWALVTVTWLIFFGAAGVSFWKVVWPMVRAEAFRANPEHHNYATLPAHVPREVPPMPEAQFDSPDAGQITVTTWQPEYRVINVQVKRAAQLQVRTSDYPGWTAFIDGQHTSIERGPVGNITLSIPAGAHQVILDYRSTPIRRASNWLTVAACGLLFALILLLYKQRSEHGSKFGTVGKTL